MNLIGPPIDPAKFYTVAEVSEYSFLDLAKYHSGHICVSRTQRLGVPERCNDLQTAAINAPINSFCRSEPVKICQTSRSVDREWENLAPKAQVEGAY